MIAYKYGKDTALGCTIGRRARGRPGLKWTDRSKQVTRSVVVSTARPGTYVMQARGNSSQGLDQGRTLVSRGKAYDKKTTQLKRVFLLAQRISLKQARNRNAV